MPSGGVTPAGGAAFNGGTITNPQVIDVGSLATAGGLTIQGTSGANVDRLKLDFLHQLLELTGDGALTISSDDNMGVGIVGTADSGASVNVSDSPANTSANMSASTSGGQVTVTDSAAVRVAGLGFSWGLMTAKNAAPTDGSLQTGQCALWFDQTNGAAALGQKAKTADGTVVTGKYPLRQSSGSLPTATFSSGTGKQVSTTQDVYLVVPCTLNPTAGAAGTVAVALSPDNVTYSALVTITEPAGVALDGTIIPASLQVPAGWYVKLTATNATIGTGTFY